MPPVTYVEGIHKGKLPATGEFLSVTEPNVIVSVIKMAEAGGDIVIRCREILGATTETILEIPFLHRQINVSLTGWQVKTYLVPRDLNEPLKETSFVED